MTMFRYAKPKEEYFLTFCGYYHSNEPTQFQLVFGHHDSNFIFMTGVKQKWLCLTLMHE